MGDIGDYWREHKEYVERKKRGAQRYQALRARIGDTAIEKLMAGEAAVVPMACSTGLIHSVDYHDDTPSPIPIPSFRAFSIDKIRLDRPQEEKQCNWSGGNDYMACGTCHQEYDYRKEPRPACPLKPQEEKPHE